MWLSSDSSEFYGEEKLHYCPETPEAHDLIHKTHVANYFKDSSIVILSCLRVIYYIFVLFCVCKNNRAKPFFKRPAFMNWLPILILVTSIGLIYFGVGILKDTIKGDGKVICQLANIDFYYTVAGTYLTGLYHYMFCAEFLNTYVALQTITEGLAIACSNFVKARSKSMPNMLLSRE